MTDQEKAVVEAAVGCMQMKSGCKKCQEAVNNYLASQKKEIEEIEEIEEIDNYAKFDYAKNVTNTEKGIIEKVNKIIAAINEMRKK